MQNTKNKKPQIKLKTAIVIFSVIILLTIIIPFIVQTSNINLIIAFATILFTIMTVTIIYFWYIGRKALENKGNLSAGWLLYKRTRPVVLVFFCIFSFIGYVRLYNAVNIAKLIKTTYDQPVEPNYYLISSLSNDCVTVIKYKGLPEDKIHNSSYAISTYWGEDGANPFTDPYYGKDIKNIIIEYGPPISCSPSFCEYHEISATIWPDGKITDSK